MPTFTYDPEAGDRMRCRNCGANGSILKVLRGTIYMGWRKEGDSPQSVEQSWSKSIICPYCRDTAQEDRRR